MGHLAGPLELVRDLAQTDPEVLEIAGHATHLELRTSLLGGTQDLLAAPAHRLLENLTELWRPLGVRHPSFLREAGYLGLTGAATCIGGSVREVGLVEDIVGKTYGVCVLILAMLGAFVVGTTMALPFVFIPRGRRERYSIWAGVVWSRFVLQVLLLARPEVTGQVRLRREEGALVVSNHRSWVDPLLLLGWTRSNGLSKAEIGWLPFIGFYGWLAGAVFFRRRSPEARARARAEVMKLVRGGHRIQVFPEGTRSRTDELGERVFLSLIEDCHREGIAVVPCAVWRTERALPTRYALARPFQRFRLDIGEPMRPQDWGEGSSFAEAVWGETCRRVAALRSEEGA